MADSPQLPGQHSWCDASGKPLPLEFFKFFRGLLTFIAESDGNSSALAELTARVDALEAAGGTDEATIGGLLSVATVGTLADGTVTITLVNDQQNPGNSYYYGTSATGTKGYHALPDPLESVLPIVTGEIVSGQPVFVIGPNGSLIFGPVL